MGFGEAISAGFANYATFTGRAARPEYWFWVLFTVLASIVCKVVDLGIGSSVGMLSVLFSLAAVLPSLAVAARRLHDIDRTGWWLLFGFVPVLGWIVLVVFLCQRGTDGPNRFGNPPMPNQPQVRNLPA